MFVGLFWNTEGTTPLRATHPALSSAAPPGNSTSTYSVLHFRSTPVPCFPCKERGEMLVHQCPHRTCCTPFLWQTVIWGKRTNRDKRLQGFLRVWPGRACNSYCRWQSSIATMSSAHFSPGWESWSEPPAITPTTEQPLFNVGMGQVACSHCLSPLSSKRWASYSSAQVD